MSAIVASKEQKGKITKIQIINLGKVSELTWGGGTKRFEQSNRPQITNIERRGS